VEGVEDILNASNIRKGTFSYEKKVFDFKNMVTTIAEGFRATAEGKGLTFVIHVPEGDWQFTGDEKQLSHVIKNLVDNSVRYTTTGSVTVDLEKSPDSIRFKVTDTGFGLSDDDKKNLFTEGGKGKESQKVNVESTGYGLYIVKGIVEAHGGKVWADSPGRSHGSSFIVELPVATVTPVTPLPNTPVPVASPAQPLPSPEQKV
jgi:signal transduction histidine kinase